MIYIAAVLGGLAFTGFLGWAFGQGGVYLGIVVTILLGWAASK